MSEFTRPKIEDEENKFLTYIEIQESGETNMFDAQMVDFIGQRDYDQSLSREDIAHIMKYYSELKEENKGNGVNDDTNHTRSN